VYLPRDSEGRPCDLEDMTYAGLLQRMVELMFVRNGGDRDGRLAPNRWIDPAYQTRTFAMLQRTERRFLAEVRGCVRGCVRACGGGWVGGWVDGWVFECLSGEETSRVMGP
jgi:enoyl reductase-like protein